MLKPQSPCYDPKTQKVCEDKTFNCRSSCKKHNEYEERTKKYNDLIRSNKDRESIIPSKAYTYQR